MSIMAGALTEPQVAAFADELHRARLARQPVATVSGRVPGLTLEDAYAIQAAGVDRRLADGERRIGGKLGFTSRAMREAMGVDSPNYGWLTDAMRLDGPSLPAGRFIHPKIEPEIAFRLSAPLTAPVTAAEVRAATGAVMACLEVVDSRFEGFRFGPLDNVADNSSAGGVLLGPEVPLDGIDLRVVGVMVEVDGAVAHTAAGAAAHDDPAAAVAWMVNACGVPLEAGEVVISGGLTSPVDLSPGTTVTATFDRLGPVTLRA